MSGFEHLGRSPVDVALVLAVDCSSSVDAGDYQMQMTGIAKAVRSPLILDAIRASPLQRLALCLVHWSNARNQTVAVPWIGISERADVEVFARVTEKVTRHWSPGGTGLGAAMRFCTQLLIDLPVAAGRLVVDVSGDGADNENGKLSEARDFAVANGVIINGLPIIYGQQHIEEYYRQNVICGPQAFVVPTSDLRGFPEAMEKKMVRELLGFGV
jgi:Protein of unknown function (DUF1194)